MIKLLAVFLAAPLVLTSCSKSSSGIPVTAAVKLTSQSSPARSLIQKELHSVLLDPRELIQWNALFKFFAICEERETVGTGFPFRSLVTGQSQGRLRI